jgi:tRNA A-37 threonylcarbamoyl transferase component Bud32
MPGSTIGGRYELIEPISSGGMGMVWRGYDTVLDRAVAVKLIRPEMLAFPEHAADLAERFRREARVTARIQHHGVPQVYDAVLDAGTPDHLYLVMELIQGTSLRAYVDPAEPVPVPWAAAMAAQISTVLSHAHAIPVVHRDLKPDNVLVTRDGTVKVLDFGIAAILRTDTTKITSTGQPIGTSRYMSPEQVNGARVTPHSDLYAVGCIVHELVAGVPVFDGSTDYELWHQHVSARPRPLRALRPDAPAALEALVLDLLAKRPERRPADAYAVYERLLPFLPAPGSPAPATSGRLLHVPDPTLMYRRPNAPRQPVRAPAVAGPPATVADAPAATPTRLRDAIDAAYKHSTELLGEERFTQAADVVRAVIASAGKVLGSESPDLLGLRMHRALILFLGGDARAALPEFDALADAFARTAGPSSPNAFECRRYAAHCRADLGEATAALQQFRRLLEELAAAEAGASDLALDVRRGIGMLLLSEGDAPAAEEVFEPLYADHVALYGEHDERSREIAEILARIRFRETSRGVHSRG